MDFDKYYKDNIKLVKKTLRKYGFRNEDLEDLTQDVFTKLWESTLKLNYTELTSPLARLTADRVAQNKLTVEKNRIRLEEEHIQGLPLDSLHGYTEEGEPEGLDLDTPEAIVEAEQLTKVLDGALDRISPELREVFILHDIHEHSHTEIADRLFITEDMSRKRLERAKDALKATL